MTLWIAGTRRRRLNLCFAVTVAVVAVAAGCGGSSTAAEREVNATTTDRHATLSLRDLTLTVPDGWDSEAFVNASGMSVFRVGSFAFPERPDDDVGQIAREAMGPDDVLINIVEYTGIDPRDDTYRPITSPLTVDGSQATFSSIGRARNAIADGAFMEPRGCNRWQSAANRLSADTAETSQNRCGGLRPVAVWIAW